MTVSSRTRVRGMTSAQTLLPSGTTVRDYLVGRASARMATGAIIAVVVFGTVFVVALAFGTVLFPGALLLIYLAHAVRPPRGVVVADEGVAVLEKSFLNGRPTKVLAMIPTASVRSIVEPSGGALSLNTGTERVLLARKEADRLRAALSASPATYPPALSASPATYPPATYPPAGSPPS